MIASSRSIFSVYLLLIYLLFVTCIPEVSQTTAIESTKSRLRVFPQPVILGGSDIREELEASTITIGIQGGDITVTYSLLDREDIEEQDLLMGNCHSLVSPYIPSNSVCLEVKFNNSQDSTTEAVNLF
ncbi:MAG: hypothetical protein H6619_02680 [Deltaproteobacteria bacterium]|nr:hypothetical protein [Deltaproteobacteria bacterium]